MPSDCLPSNVTIPLPLTLYVIPLAFMVEYIMQQLWALIHHSLEEAGDIPPPSSSPLPSPPSSLGENHVIGAYETLPTSPTPVLPHRLRSATIAKGIPSRTLYAISESSLNHPLCPILLCCLLCHSLEHGFQNCPQHRCPICLHATLGHRNNSCPNSSIDLDSSDNELYSMRTFKGYLIQCLES